MGGLFSSFDSFLASFASDVPIESPIISPRPSQQGTFNTSLGPMTHDQLAAYLQSQGIQATSSGPTSSDSSTGSTGGGIGGTMQSAAQAMSSSLQGAAQALSGGLQKGAASSGGTGGALATMLLSNRLVTGVIGLICIAAGLFMFKGTQQVITTTAKTAAKLAA